MSKTRIVIAGIRHYHILELINHAKATEGCEVVALCEENAEGREVLKRDRGIEVDYTSYDELLKWGDFDVVAIGDVYSKRGGMVIKALEAGKHVIVDKPLCTSLEELDQIEALAKKKNLSVMIQLTMRGSGICRALYELVRGGKLGKIRAISFGGQHALNFGVRPGWYFTGNQHRGTINDIAIHGVDAIRWITGQELYSVESARCWCSRPEMWPEFKDGAQAHFTLNNDIGVLADVSYFAPDRIQYPFPLYWRFTFWGTEGVAEVSHASKHVTLYMNDSASEEHYPLAEKLPTFYLDSFLNEIRGTQTAGQLTTEECIKSSRTTLQIQRAADLAQPKPVAT